MAESNVIKNSLVKPVFGDKDIINLILSDDNEYFVSYNVDYDVAYDLAIELLKTCKKLNQKM